MSEDREPYQATEIGLSPSGLHRALLALLDAIERGAWVDATAQARALLEAPPICIALEGPTLSQVQYAYKIERVVDALMAARLVITGMVFIAGEGPGGPTEEDPTINLGSLEIGFAPGPAAQEISLSDSPLQRR